MPCGRRHTAAEFPGAGRRLARSVGAHGPAAEPLRARHSAVRADPGPAVRAQGFAQQTVDPRARAAPLSSLLR